MRQTLLILTLFPLVFTLTALALPDNTQTVPQCTGTGPFASSWCFIENKSAMLSKIGGGILAFIVAITPIYIARQKATDHVKAQPSNGDSAPKQTLEEAKKELRKEILDAQNQLRGEITRGTGRVRKVQTITSLTFVILLATLGLYTVSTTNRLNAIASEARKAANDAKNALTKANEAPKIESKPSADRRGQQTPKDRKKLAPPLVPTPTPQ